MRRALAVGLALVALSGCSGKSNGAHHVSGPDERLVKAAHLDPCPASSATPVSGGLPDVTLACLAPGRSVHMAGLAGEPTVVNVWGSWCEPCQKEERYLSSAYDQLKGKVQFLGVDTEDDADSALDFDAHVSPPVHFPSVVDDDKAILLGLHPAVAGPPVTVFLDSSGHVVGTHPGPFTSTTELTDAIARYLHVTT
jgi:thiol-disulfide isomerase/thioredoxin